MTLLASDIIIDVRQHVRQPDSANANLTDDDLLPYFNECTAYLSRELKTYQQTRLYSTAYIGSKLPLPGYCYSIIGVNDASGYALSELSVPELRIANATDGLCYGIGTGYGVFGNHLWLAPAFQAVTLLYAGRVPKITDPANEIDCPASWDRAITLWVTRAYLRELESQRFAIYDNDFKQELIELKSAERSRHEPLPKAPRVV